MRLYYTRSQTCMHALHFLTFSGIYIYICVWSTLTFTWVSFSSHHIPFHPIPSHYITYMTIIKMNETHIATSRTRRRKALLRAVLAASLSRGRAALAVVPALGVDVAQCRAEDEIPTRHPWAGEIWEIVVGWCSEKKGGNHETMRKWWALEVLVTM